MNVARVANAVRIAALRGGASLLPVAGLAGLLAACGGQATGSATAAPQAGAAAAALPFPDTGSRLGAQPGAQVISFEVVGPDQGAVGPDGRHHDTFRATSPTTVAGGQAVTVEITNRDDMPHSFTLPELSIDRLVPAATESAPGTVTFTFTPAKAGTYRWFCAIPCDTDNNGWAMGAYGAMGMGGKGMMEPGVDGFMAGYITVA